jgi:hypothetical protein
MFATTPPGRTIRVQRSKVAGIPDGLDRVVHATPVGEVQDLLLCLVSRSERMRRAELLGMFEPGARRLDRDDPAGAGDCRGHDRGQPDGTGTDDRDRVARLHAAVLHADLEARGQDVGEKQHLLIGHAIRDKVDRGLGIGYAGELGLHAVDQVVEDPADPTHRLAVGGDAALAGATAPARGDRGDEDPVALLQSVDRRAGFDNRPDRLVSERPSVGHGRDVALEDV